MPARSGSQQRLFGMVHAYQKGKLKHAPAKVREVARHISEEDAEHFARTSHEGLPERKGKKKESEKDASAAVKVAVRVGRKTHVFPSAKSAILYLASLPGVSPADARKAVEGRMPTVGKMSAVTLSYP